MTPRRPARPSPPSRLSPPSRGAPGRPKNRLPAAKAALTRQVRRLVDEAHGGNLREAASYTGTAYGTLRDLYVGRSANPGLRTVEALVSAYGLAPGWLTSDRETPDPLTAVVGILPPDPEVGRGRLGRRITIPLAAWPLARLFLLLEPYLASFPPAPGRLILGGANDDDARRQRLTTFLLAPLLDAQELDQLVLLEADPPFRGTEHPSPEERQAWIETLRGLGVFWERALAGLIRRAEAYRLRTEP